MIRIAIVEDEIRAAETLERYVRTYEASAGESFQIVLFSNPVSFLEPYLGYDLVFMDIQMPLMDGMEAARRLRKIDTQAKLIFVTSMAQYAVKGYEVDALGFIVKPVAYQDFGFQMKRAMSSISMSRQRDIMLTQASGVVRISSGDLLYVEVRGHKLFYHTTKQLVEARGTMEQTEQQLSQWHFLRCNNCYLVNPRYIQWVQGYVVKVGEDELQISHPKRKKFLESLSNWYAEGGM